MALQVAAGDGPPAKVAGCRQWLTTSSETLRVISGHAGTDLADWHGRRVPALKALWRRDSAAA